MPAARGRHHGDRFDDERVAISLEAEGDLASGLTAEAIELCAGRLAAAGVTVGRILDLGCGPGVATAQLAQRFRRATVVAIDGSAVMLARAEARAARLGLAGRVETRGMDLNADLQTLGTCELAYAAMAIHHADDEVATLTGIRRLLRPGGLACVLERADTLAVQLAGDLGRPGLWERLRAARAQWFERARPTLPGAMNTERYPEMLASAGLEVVVSRTIGATVPAPADPATRAFLSGRLRGAANDLAGAADAADIDALRAFIEAGGADSDRAWSGATVSLSRRLFIAR